MIRRLPIFLASAAIAVLLSAQQLRAEDATQTLKTAIETIMAAIRNPDYANPATRVPLRKKIEQEVFKVFDFGEFSSRTVGPRWKSFSAEQKKEFSDAFAQLLLNTYLNRVKGYNGETISYLGSIGSKDGQKVEVRTEIAMQDGKKTPVFYRMLLKGGKWYVYDVIIENISLVKNYRTQFQSILNSASPEELIARIRARATEISAQKAN